MDESVAQMDVSETVMESKEISSMGRQSQSSNRSDIDVGIDATTLPPVDFRKEIVEASDQMFDNVKNYLSSEIEVTIEDYKLLETMNNVTKDKYQEMTSTAENIAQSMEDLNEKFVTILPKLELIDQLDKKVEHLEKLAYAIDAYSKRLEKQYKAMEKRIASVGNVDTNSSSAAGSSSRSSTPQIGRF